LTFPLSSEIDELTAFAANNFGTSASSENEVADDVQREDNSGRTYDDQLDAEAGEQSNRLSLGNHYHQTAGGSPSVAVVEG
jgi:hypothetical protein